MDETGREFIEIFYKNDDKLYVPADQIDRIQPYKSYQKNNPQLESLGSTKWIKSKNKAKQSIEILAAELLKIYAAREKIKGNKYSEDSDWQKILEESFEFKETKDQLSAIEEIKNDLESKNPMDRLLCGDVGYGKTEVAIRAAFKSVENGYQVAILVPTTVLALQHFQTFFEVLLYSSKLLLFHRLVIYIDFGFLLIFVSLGFFFIVFCCFKTRTNKHKKQEF